MIVGDSCVELSLSASMQFKIVAPTCAGLTSDCSSAGSDVGMGCPNGDAMYAEVQFYSQAF